MQTKGSLKKIFRHPWFPAAVLLVLGLVTRFAFFGYPQEVVFDEVYFGGYASSYDNGSYFFDVHPPLGKLIITAAGKAAGWQPEQNFKNIGQKVTTSSYYSLRFLPSLAGALLPLVVFLLCLELGFRRKASFMAGLLIVFENSLLTQSHYILLDSFLILFGFAGLLFYFAARRKGSLPLLIGSSVFLACALSVKWTGAAFLGLVLLLEAWRIFKKKEWRDIPRDLALFFVVPAALYFSFFAIHFALLPRTGPGDGFMSDQFKKTLVDSDSYANPGVPPLSLFAKFVELNKVMYTTNRDLTKMHSYSSKWYTWPFNIRPIYYWQSKGDGVESNIYFLGNPVIYWLSTFAVLLLFLEYTTGGGLITRNRKAAGFVLLGYAANFLPFMFIGRVMFLYHYEAALVFAVLALCLLVDGIKKESLEDKVWVLLIGASFAAFLFFAPFTYGLPLSPAALQARIWLPSWR